MNAHEREEALLTLEMLLIIAFFIWVSCDGC